MGSSAEAVTAFRRKLLPSTVRHAATNVPAYHSAYAGIEWQRVGTAADLSRLPIIDKRQVQADWQAFICPGLTLAHVQHTSGTTGESLFLLRSAEEQDFILRFMANVGRPKLSGPATAVVLEEAYHGSSTAVPSVFQIIKGSITDDRAIDNALRLLTLPSRLKGRLGPVRVLAGTDTAIRAVTHLAGLRLAEPAALDIQAVHTYGDLLPPTVRRRIEDTWAALVVDRYSMVEHFGSASLVPGTGIYAFDTHIQPEVVDPVTRRPIHSGRGVLVLTSLYPFVQMMPMIRYWTGDAVELVGSDEDYTSLRFRILGRLDSCLRDKAGVPVLGVVEWLDALETVPGVAFRSRRTDLSLEGVVRAIGRPQIDWRPSPGLDTVEAVLGVVDGADPEAVTQAAHEAILAHAPLFAARVRDGRTCFTVTVGNDPNRRQAGAMASAVT